MPIYWVIVYVSFSLFQRRNVSMVTGKQAELRKKKMDKVVIRLVFLMCAYAVLMALAYAPICVLQQHSKLLEYYVKQYFGCLMFFPPDHCLKSKYFTVKCFFRASVVKCVV